MITQTIPDTPPLVESLPSEQQPLDSSDAELRPCWLGLEGDALTRTFARADFVEALALTVEIGKLAEAANHHPDIKLHRYRFVLVSLTSHDSGNSVTEKDFGLAQQINDLSDDVIRQTTDELRRRFQS